ncbi:MAG: putative membrane protein YfcA [Myxococcota bacterium]|jgi:uncharacterized membrane protein YfcA
MMILLLGLLAGMVTTVAGMGGGMLLMLSMAMLIDPLSSLVISAPALLLGNLHRLSMYRRSVQWSLSGRLILGAVPGSLAGGLLAVSLPGTLIQWLMAAMTIVALLRTTGIIRGSLPQAGLVPTGAVIGTIHATCGGAGPLVGALLQSEGLAQVPYVATIASLSVTLHAARLTAYGIGGAVETDLIVQGLGLAVAITAGNLIGDRLRRRMGDALQARTQKLILLGSISLAIGALVV